jgi:hypothetical protein
VSGAEPQVRRLTFRNRPPPDSNIAVVALAHEPRDVNIRAREIRSGVEKIEQLPARHDVQRRVGIKTRQKAALLFLFLGLLECIQRRRVGCAIQQHDCFGRGFDLREFVRERSLTICLGTFTGTLLVVLGIKFIRALIGVSPINDDDLAPSSVPRATPEPLDEGRPRREFGHKRVGGDVHSGLDNLRRHDDPVTA